MPIGNIVLVAGPSRRRSSLTDLPTYKSRHRHQSDPRYTPGGSTHLTTGYTPHYSSNDTTTPRYTSQYGTYSDFPREPYLPYTSLSSSHYSDGGSMSKYTRSYDITNKNHDYTPKSYDSQRLFDRGRGDTDVTAPFEFGVSYKSPRTHDTSTKTYDTSTKTYDRHTRNDDVISRRSPARTTSLSDRTRPGSGSGGDVPTDLPTFRGQGRQRTNSGDSSSSQTSEKSAHTEDRSLFSALKNRYKENAERPTDDPGVRTPFSSWRRSGHFDDVAPILSQDGEKDVTQSQLDKNDTSNKFHDTDGSYASKDRNLSKRDSHREDKSDRSNVKGQESSSAQTQQTEASADDLIFNFRTALRRHALSENEKSEQKNEASETSDKAQMEDDINVARLERLRAHRARIQEQRKTDRIKSDSFAEENRSNKEDVKIDKRRTGSEKIEKSRYNSVETIEKDAIDTNLTHKPSTKLARQKLVSDDLKAKYMESHKTDNDTETHEESLSRKRSNRKSKHKEHMEYWSKDQEISKDSKSANTDSKPEADVPTVEEMLLGSTKHSIRKNSPSMARKFDKGVDHSSPFGLVYTTKPAVQPSSTSLSIMPGTNTENKKEKVQNDKHEKEVTETKQLLQETPVTSKDKTRSPRVYKKYTKAKSLELGALSKMDDTPEPLKKHDSKDDLALEPALSIADDLAQMSRKDRIARYKEERRKQLATISNRFSGAESELPSLFLSSKSSQGEDSPLLRSKSLRVESEAKPEKAFGAIARSKSLKQDKDMDSSPDSFSPASRGVPKLTGLNLAEIGNQSTSSNLDKGKDIYDTDEQKYNTDNIIDKLQALKKLKEEHLKKSSVTLEELQAKRSIKENDELKNSRLSIGEPVSYASKTLLADRVMEGSSDNKYVSKTRERIPSQERGRSGSKERDTKQTLAMKQKPFETVAETPAPNSAAKHRSQSDRTETDSDSKVKYRTFSDKSYEKDKEKRSSFFEFGTVYTKKDKDLKNHDTSKDSIELSDSSKNVTKDKSYTEVDSESGRDSADSNARIRRRLPSLEDVLGTGEKETLEKLKKDYASKAAESETTKPKSKWSKDNIASMSADERSRKKILENIEKAKSRFKEDDKNVGKSETGPFELGTVFTTKKVEKVEKVEEKTKTSKLPLSPRMEKKSDQKKKEKKEKISTEQSRQLLLGLDETKKEPNVTKKADQGKTAKSQAKVKSKEQSRQLLFGLNEDQTVSNKKDKKVVLRTESAKSTDAQTKVKSQTKLSQPSKTEIPRMNLSQKQDKESPKTTRKIKKEETDSPKTTRKIKKEETDSPKVTRKTKKEETVSPRTEKDVKALKPPTSPRSSPRASPRSDRKKMAEQRFGKVSYRESGEPHQAFEFGTSYTKKTDTATKQTQEAKLAEKKAFEGVCSPIMVRKSKMKESNDASKNKDAKKQDDAKNVSTISKTTDSDLSTFDMTKLAKSKFENKSSIQSVPPFGATYTKPEPTKAESKVTSIKLASQKSEEKGDNITISDTKLERKQSDREIKSPIRSKVDPQIKFDIKAQAVSTAVGKSPEVPTSPRRQSPIRVITDPIKGIQGKENDAKILVSPTEIRGIKIDNIKSSKTKEAKPEVIKPPEIVSTIKTTSVSTVQSKSPSETKPAECKTPAEPVRQTSITKMEVTSPTTKTKDENIKKVEPKVIEQSPLKTTSTFTFNTKSVLETKPTVEKVVNKPAQDKAITKPNIDKTVTKIETKATKSGSKSEQKSEVTQKEKVAPTKSETSNKQEKELKTAEVDNGLVQKDVSSRIGQKAEIMIEKLGLDPKKTFAPKPEAEIPKDKSARIEEKAEIMIEKLGLDPLKKAEAKKVDERGRKIERGKPVKTKGEKPVVTKLRVEKLLMDTSLDDILNRNVDYLSDMEPPEFQRGRVGDKKSRPQSIHEHQKPKRNLKKKTSMRRSKSEDRSHFKVIDSDEDGEITRSKVKENLQKSASAIKVTQPTRVKTIDDKQNSPPTTSKTDGQTTQSHQEVTSTKLLSERFQNLQQNISKTDEKKETQSANKLQTGFKNQNENHNQSIISAGLQKHTSSVSENIFAENIRKEVQDNFPPNVNQSAAEFTSEMASDTSDSRRFAGQTSTDAAKDSETSRMTTTDSDVSVSSVMSEGSRKRRKDKSSLRKSKLNESGEDVVTPIRCKDSGEDNSRQNKIGVRRVASSRLARESREDKYKENNNEEVSSAISKLSEAKERSSKENSPFKKAEDLNSPRGLKRGNNFSQLLQKFSSSEASGSEKSDSDTHSPRGRKTFLKRQEAYAVSSPSSDDARRTPERTQSLRLRGTPDREVDKDSDNSLQRSASFKSDFMKRRYSPESENRRRLPATPKEHQVEQSDKPSPELAKVLNKRSAIVTKQQDEGESIERGRIHDGKVEKANRYSSAAVDEVIADSEVLAMLKSRRKDTDSSVDTSSVSEMENKSQINNKQRTSEIGKVSQKALSQDRSQQESVNKSRTPSQSSFESKTSINISTTSRVKQDLPVEPQNDTIKTTSAIKPDTIITKVPQLDLSSIDTSLAVLESVTDDIGTLQDDTKHSKNVKGDTKIHQALSSVNVSSPKEVVQFIKSVESDLTKTNQRVTDKSDTKLNVDIVKSEKERKLTEQVNMKPDKTVQSQTVKSEPRTDKDPDLQIPTSPTSPNSGAIDITSKSEIMRKISTREKTPELQPSKKTGPMKVTSTFLSTSSGSSLTRTESVGRSESERPKGILKRTPSLKHSGVNVDPELADVLRSRRQRHEEVEEEEESGKLSVQEEIQREREAQQQKDAADEAGREVSVAERVFQMYNKIEETKSCPITPRARSGFTTPKSILVQSGNITPKNQLSFDADSDTKSSKAISGPQLIERLTSLEGQQTSVSEKRQKFQKRKRDDARTRTQPVTIQEIQLADSLETVRKFRSEVIQKASKNIFESLQKDDKLSPLKKTEFPQHLPREKRPRGQRHKTLPVTAAELSAVPEGQVTDTMNSLKKKFESFGARDSKADSGILSGSDGDNLSIDENITDDDPVKMSVSAKASMFLQIQENLKESKEKKSASGAKRYIDRKKRERSRTLPITEEEVKLAAEIADAEEKENAKQAEEGVTEPVLPTEAGEGDVSDELTRQSLKDKVKLFTSIEEEKKVAAQKKGAPPPPPKRRGRKVASRFATQPITFEEVEKAAKISPLACSLVKPPDPEILSGLSIKAARELIQQHAHQTLSQPGSRTGSRVGSRSTSISDLTASVKNQDPVTVNNTDINQNAFPVTIDTGAESGSVKPSDIRSKGFTPLKHEEEHKTHTVEKISSELDSKKKSILKSELEQKLSMSLLHDSKGILKPNVDSVPTISDIKSVLKKESSLERTKSSEVRSILKKEGSFETKKYEPEKDLLKGVDSMYKNVVSEITENVESETISVEGLSSSGDNLDSDEGLLEGGSHSADTPARRREKKSRRRFNRDQKAETERYRTQPTETAPESPDASRVKKKYGVARHLTQPVTPDEKKEAEIATDMPEISKTGSIHDRLNALKKSGDEEWKKRVSSPLDRDKLERRSMSPPTTPPNVKMRDKKGLDMPRPSSIADRLTLLDSSQGGWRDRVGETDVKKFTIEHKIASSGQTVGESPLVSRLRARQQLSRDSESSENGDLGSPTSPTKESLKFPAPKEVICTDIPIEMLQGDSQSPLTTAEPIEEEDKRPTKVEVPNMDAELDLFFHSERKSKALSAKTPELDVSVDDFNELFLSANDILETTRKIKPKRRHNPTSRNPLKTMSACLEVKTEYTEVITGVAERELKRVKTDQISANSGFAVEALAGLASKENFSKIELRKTDSNGTGSPAGNTRMDPYLPLMLIHIKGRRRVQCRLVEPRAESINSGDCYVLITPDKLIQWHGDYCNVIEKAKAADFCDFVKQKRDLGCKKASDVTTVEECRGTLGGGRHFWSLLGGHKPHMACGPAEEDELYENHVVETNMIYKLESNKLVPVKEYWGNQPKYEMLTKDQVFVFDFGSELYLWQGKAVSPTHRKISVKLAQQLWNNGYDYSTCDINPVSPLRGVEEGGLPSVGDTRPDWALFGKVNQNMETILFREKFADWPDTSRLIKAKSQEEVNQPKFDLADLKAVDATTMVPVNTSPVSMVLEGSHVGRGNKWQQDMDGFIQEQIIETLKVVVWHVLEYEHYEIEDHSYGQFHEGDTYVVRWQYMIINAGMKNLKGQASRRSNLGRERCAYFFWQGKSSTINEKGASALMTVELDEERGPQVRVDEGKEPACFLNLFKGHMITHIGKREEEESNSEGPWKFYCLRNEYDNEISLIEVEKDASNLRSVSSLLMLNVVTGALKIWHGCKSPEHTKKLAVKAAENLKEKCPLEVGVHKGVKIDISEVDEGHDRRDFWRTLNIQMGARNAYHSLLDNPKSFNHTLRLFHMTSVSGVFEAAEIINPSRSPDLPTKFPVLQTDLYKVSQPALFLIDNGHEVYLWQGWWPEGDEEQENVLTGSASTRFTADRRCAMETTIAYCKEINPDNPPPSYLVYAGLEPLSFTNLFPFWTVDETVQDNNLRQSEEQDRPVKINTQDGKTEGELVPVEDLLKKLTKTRYPLVELLDTPLPEGVDPLKLESYLSDEEFEHILDMNREDFYALPAWKQQKMKQQCGLF